MSWALNEDGSRVRGQPVTGQDLEERINMYISAMDKATTVNDESMSAQLQRDIQHLVDLMEKVASGHSVMDTEVPPPLVMTPIHDAVANPLGELSSRLSDYHKALYFAEEELSENRLEKIQTLQKGLQNIHSLQKRAQAGFPIKEDEIPSPVAIPDDSEFDNDAFNTITARLDQYKTALSFCEKASSGEDRRRIPKLQSAIRKLNFLLTRAQVKRPVWRKDIPPEFEYFYQEGSELKTKAENVAKLTIQARALQDRVSKCTNPRLQKTKDSIHEGLEKLIVKWTEAKVVSAEDSTNLSTFSSMLDNLERNSVSDYELIDSRIKEYKTAALKAKREDNVDQAIKDLKVVKGLQPMRDALERGEFVDMTLVPPPPRETTSTGELPPSFTSVTDSTTNTDTETGPQSAPLSAPQSAHAQVSPFNIRPATETAEDKLARKLTSFLEDEGELKSFASPSSSSPSSLESDLSPVSRPDMSREKMKTLNEEERELKANIEELNPAAPNVESSNPNDSPSHSMPEENPSAIDVRQPEQVVEGNVDDLSIDVKEETDKGSSSLLVETALGDKEESNAVVPLEAEIESVICSQAAEERIGESRNETMSKEEESEPKSDFEETQKMIVESAKDNSSSPNKVIGSKNPLDKIGFLACQDVPLPAKEREMFDSNSCKSANIVDESYSLSRENDEGSDKDITNNFDNGCLGQTQSEKDPCFSLASELGSSKDKDDGSPIPHSSPSSVCKLNDTISNEDSFSQERNLPTTNTDPERDETNSPAQASQGRFLLSESSSNSALPYSVNNQNINDIYEKSTKNEWPYVSNTQSSDDISVPAKSDVRNFYNLSADSMNFDDASDMQEFQELMESMSIGNDTSSLATGDATDAQSSDKIASLKPAAANQLNSALFNSSSTIPGSAPHTSLNVDQSVNYADTNLNATTSESSVESPLTNSTATQLNAQPTSTTTLTELGTSLTPQVSYQQQESFINKANSVPWATSRLQNIQLTGLETLKYDLLLAENKTSQSAKKVVGKIQEQMEMIKHYLRQGGRKDWEEYKTCLEKELQTLNDGVRDCGERQEWDAYKYLNNKRMLNEKELCYLKQRIEEIKE